MIPHHQGAIRMAEGVGVNGQDTFLLQMSNDMISAQSAQIYDMEQMR